MRARVPLLSVASMLLIAPLVHADPRPGPLFPRSEVGACWDDDHITSVYAPNGLTPAVPLLTGAMCGIEGQGLYLDDWTDPMPEGDMKAIAALCKQKSIGDTYRDLRCVSEAVDQYVNAHFHYDGNSKNGSRSFCRDHERAFRQVMDSMGMPNVKVGNTCITWHIANTVTITANDGQQYTYVIDTGWYPDQMNPLPGTACQYAKDHPEDPLPAVGNSVGQSSAVGASTTATGTNVDRLATTRPTQPARTGTSIGGGVDR